MVRAVATSELFTAKVAEAWGDIIDPRELFGGGAYDELDRGGGYGFGGYAIDQRGNRDRGEDYPRFRTEHDLARIRGMGRFFAEKSAFGVGALGRLGHYTFGTGFTFTPQAAEGLNVADELIAAVKRVINAFTDRNKFVGVKDREIDRRARRDGESILCLDLVDGWQADLRFAEPSQLTEPAAARQIEDWLTGSGKCDCDSFVSSWSFGVHTRDGRHDRPMGYHLVWNAEGTEWDYYAEARVAHFKRNVDEAVKRGVSDFDAISEFIPASEKLLRNTAGGAAIQAAIPFVKEFIQETTKDQIDEIKSAGSTRRSIATAEGRREIFQQHFRPGTIPHIRGSKFVDGPGGDSRVNGFIAALQACFRYMGTRWDMPESMISGDASNNNMASALVAESPFVKAREADQLVYSAEYRALLWKVIRIAFDGGFFDRFRLSFCELQEAIFIKIDPPSVATRDKLKDVQADSILVDKGAMAVSTMAANAGLDHKAEVDAGAKPAALPAFGGMLAGSGGMLGANPANPTDPTNTLRTPPSPQADPAKPATEAVKRNPWCEYPLPVKSA